MTKEFGIARIKVEEGVHLGFGINVFVTSQCGVVKGNSFIAQCCASGANFTSMKTKFSDNIGCVMSLKWSHVR
jgi:hypothetical protein